MSQSKNWTAEKDTTVRKDRSSGATAGQGLSKHGYVGRSSGNNYDTYIKCTLDWTDVGQIVKATLVLFTDDGSGDFDLTTDEHPHVVVRRLTDGFTEGNAPDGTWQANDWTSATGTTSDQRSVDVSRAANATNRIDITSMVEDWAPAAVKRRSGVAGGKATNYGIGLYGTAANTENVAFWSRHATDAQVRPFIELVYEFGITVPSVPTSLTPVGAVASIGSFQGNFADVRSTDQLRFSHVQVYANNAVKAGTAALNNVVTINAHGFANGTAIWFHTLTGGTGLTASKAYYVRDRTTNTFKVATAVGGTPVDITNDYSAVSAGVALYDVKLPASNTEVINDRFDHVPSDLTLLRGTTYQWRARVFDNEGQASGFTGLTSFSITNTNPTAPTPKPANASTYASLDGVVFTSSVAFSDPDPGSRLLAYQVQLSPYASGDPRWDETSSLLWDTGKTYVASGSTNFETDYGGAPLTAGTYYWRSRVWDEHDGVSTWAYASIILTVDFDQLPGASTSIQLRPRAPWRVVIKALGANRGPGATVAILEHAKSVGASIVYNSPGEAHWTLTVDDPQLAVIEPKQTHYSIQFYTGNGWREVFAGLVWDVDATEKDVVFYGIDYLALFDYVLDERYDPSVPNKAAEKGGSYYVTSGKNSIRYIVLDQLARAVSATKYPNTPVGFITVGSVATMNETLAVYSTYQPTLGFVTGLLDSHRQGTGKRTRIQVRQTTSGGYEVIVQDDPGQQRDNLRLRYGELVQGYRVIFFGQDWASRVSGIGRTRDGIRVLYKTKTSPGIDEAVWGRFARATIVDGVSDANDLGRRVSQLATRAGKLGKQMGLGLRTGVLQPLDGYDLTDTFPVHVQHGSVDTTAFGSGLWSAMAIAWEAGDEGQQTTVLTLQPKEDTVAPDTDLLLLQPISPQDEWQLGWAAPNPLQATSRYWLDQSTGKVYRRESSGTTRSGITGTP